MSLTSIEICTGAGGAALGLEQAGFDHEVLVELDKHACATLVQNRPGWNVLSEMNVRDFSGTSYRGKIDLLAGGVPCPPFSVAGKRLGALDDRDLFPEVLRLADEIRPRAVFVENVRGLLDPVFESYRRQIGEALLDLGLVPSWRLVNACDFGVPQLRPRTILVALERSLIGYYTPPSGDRSNTPTVGEALLDEMKKGGWKGAEAWAQLADGIAPTLVGGSKLHGGPDLGPTRARAAWAQLGVDGRTLADAPPSPDHEGMPRLTIPMAAIIQGFPPEWEIVGKKTQAYRQVGNAFPPPVAKAVGLAIGQAMNAEGAAPSAA